MIVAQLIVSPCHYLIDLDIAIGGLFRWMAIIRTRSRVTPRNELESILRYRIKMIRADFVQDARTGDVWPRGCRRVPEVSNSFEASRCDE